MKQPSSALDPPRPLGVPGASLWASVQDEFCIEDCAGREILYQACAACDLAEALRERIVAEGYTIKAAHGLKSHPAVRDELQARALVTRTLTKLGIAFEPVRQMGPGPRRHSSKHWTPDEDGK